MRVEHQFLGLARIGAHEHHPAVTEADVRHLHGRRHAVHQRDFVAPVELVGLARRKAQWNIGLSRRCAARVRQVALMPTDGVIAPAIAQTSATPRYFGSASAGGRPAFLRSQEAKPQAGRARGPSSAEAGCLARTELRRVRTEDLPNHLPRNPQFAADRLDRFTLNKIGTTDLRDRLHNQHLKLGLR